MIPTVYRGSVKDVRGPARVENIPALVFEYTDAYSVFDWGKMPDPLPHKGQALAAIASDWFERLENPETWRAFSKSAEALALRKGNRFGSAFNELGEELQKNGLRTHYLGALKAAPSDSDGELEPVSGAALEAPFSHMAVRAVSVVKPALGTVLGRALPDYLPTRSSPAPRLVPLEVVFRFSCPEGSSLIERVSKDAGYLASIGFPHLQVTPGAKWDFPVLEMFTKLETTDRPLPLTEALAISGISAAELQGLLFKTAWIATLLRWICAGKGLELADGKLEWGISETGETFLVDAIGPDELRILSKGVQLSKEFLRTYYRATPWFEKLNRGKAEAKQQGISDWKRLVGEAPPALTPQYKELGSQLYMALANALTGKTWFKDAWPLEKVLSGLS